MATRTIQTGDDVEGALAFLAKQKGVDSEKFFMDEVSKVFQNHLDKADELRFDLAKKIMNEGNKGESISKLRKLLNG